jgi:hypothetical protein
MEAMRIDLIETPLELCVAIYASTDVLGLHYLLLAGRRGEGEARVADARRRVD